MHTIGGEEKWVGEDLEEDMECGLEEGPLATYLHGRGLDGFLEEGHAGGFSQAFT